MRALILLLIIFMVSCDTNTVAIDDTDKNVPFSWENATIYFLMTDRFFDGDPTNNYQHSPDNPPAPYRGYMGGDIKGITKKIKDGYFTDLGVNAIWMTPLVEQIDGSVDEGTGNSFGFHGYWTKDWTALDEKFGTEADLKELVTTAHENNIRILIDVVANHTGPVTSSDSRWPEEWVKTGPRCTYESAETTINCTLVENLPDIRTESDEEVSLPDFLVAKWKDEGRYDEEVAELDQWFAMTGYKQTPVNYILKWLVDFIKEYGVDGFRVDTVKHTEAYVWKRLWKQASDAWEKYKDQYPEEIIDDSEFYMVGEVYNYFIGNGRIYDYGDVEVDFYDDAFQSLINFDFKYDAQKGYEEIFSKYDSLLHGPMQGKTVVNYISSHDDGSPFDKQRERALEAGTKLLLCPGGAQIYYGDETARSLSVEADGDAVLRSFMNWEELFNSKVVMGEYNTKDVLAHWQKLGRFRRDNIAIGAGKHEIISQEPYVFSRKYRDQSFQNEVVVALDVNSATSIDVSSVFNEGSTVIDHYTGEKMVVKNGRVPIPSSRPVVLLSK